jgi:hypothetical protein
MIKESRRTVQIGATIALILISFIAFMYQTIDVGIFGLIVDIVALLWFPGAIVLSGLFVPGVSKTRELPIWVGVISVIVYMTETYFDAYIAGILGLRTPNVLILIPPPALPYAWLRIPEMYQVFIQFGITLILASLIFWLGLKLSLYLSRNDTVKRVS